jgi:hypothetical protein
MALPCMLAKGAGFTLVPQVSVHTPSRKEPLAVPTEQGKQLLDLFVAPQSLQCSPVRERVLALPWRSYLLPSDLFTSRLPPLAKLVTKCAVPTSNESLVYTVLKIVNQDDHSVDDHQCLPRTDS